MGKLLYHLSTPSMFMGSIFQSEKGRCSPSIDSLIGTSMLVLLLVEVLYKSPFLTILCLCKNLRLPIGMYLVKNFCLYSIAMGPRTCLGQKKFSNRIFVSSILCFFSISCFSSSALSCQFFSPRHALQKLQSVITFGCIPPYFYPFGPCKPFFLLPISLTFCFLFTSFNWIFYFGLYSILLWFHNTKGSDHAYPM